ncbi:MAG: acyl-CoA thioesterase [Pseudomonadota bacterium]
MNLFLRLLALLVRNTFSNVRIGYLDTAVLKFRVWITDQDAFMHMNNSRYNSISDLAGLDLMMKVGVLNPMRKAGYLPVIVYRGVTLHRMLKFPDAYEVQSKITAWEGPYVCFQHDFMRRDTLCAQVISIGRIVGKGADKPYIERILKAFDMPAPPASPPLSDFCRMKIDEIERARDARKRNRPDEGKRAA